MKRFSVVYLRPAQRDLISITQYIRRDDPSRADGWLDKVERILGRLAKFPESGTTPKDARLAALGYRMIPIGEYLGFYVIRRNTVQIRRVLHGRRRYSFLLR